MSRLRRTVLRDVGIGGLFGMSGVASAQSGDSLALSVQSASDVGSSSATLHGSLDDLGGADSAEVALKYRRASSTDQSDYEVATRQTLTSTGSFSGSATELSPETEYEYHAIANASDGDSTATTNTTFTTQTSEDPAVSTAGTSDVDSTSATLQAELDHLGGASSAEVAIKYRPASSSDSSDYVDATRQTLSSTGSFSGTVSGLDPSTTYEFHAIANADDGDSDASPNETFSTTDSSVLAISTAGTSDLGSSSATLHGSLDDLGGASSTEVALKYRPSTSEDQSDYEAATRQTLSSTGSFSGTANGLDAATEYEFHAIANASDGDSTATVNERFTTDSTSGGSSFDYTDGFADVAWFDDSVDVYSIQNATRSEFESAVTASGPRVIVFETSGTIDLEESTITVSNDHCWVAGQTAPSPGITLIRGGLYFDADDCVLQHVRLRAGDAGNDSGWEPDSGHTGDDTANNIFDHVTASWGVDENLSVGYRTTDTTMVNCLIYEALVDASHSKGSHSMGTLTGDDSTGVAYAGNVWAHNHNRNPRLKSGTRPTVVNNLIYHFKNGTALDPTVVADIEGNGYDRTDDDYCIKGNVKDGDEPEAYLADNYTDDDNQVDNGYITELDSRPFWPDGLTAMPAGDVESHNLTYAGARPADRTADDSRVVDDVTDGTGSFIDSQSEVGGYPQLAENTHTLDVPDTGLREWLDQWALAVEEPDASPP